MPNLTPKIQPDFTVDVFQNMFNEAKSFPEPRYVLTSPRVYGRIKEIKDWWESLPWYHRAWLTLVENIRERLFRE